MAEINENVIVLEVAEKVRVGELARGFVSGLAGTAQEAPPALETGLRKKI